MSDDNDALIPVGESGPLAAAAFLAGVAIDRWARDGGGLVGVAATSPDKVAVRIFEDPAVQAALTQAFGSPLGQEQRLDTPTTHDPTADCTYDITVTSFTNDVTLIDELFTAVANAAHTWGEDRQIELFCSGRFAPIGEPDETADMVQVKKGTLAGLTGNVRRWRNKASSERHRRQCWRIRALNAEQQTKVMAEVLSDIDTAVRLGGMSPYNLFSLGFIWAQNQDALLAGETTWAAQKQGAQQPVPVAATEPAQEAGSTQAPVRTVQREASDVPDPAKSDERLYGEPGAEVLYRTIEEAWNATNAPVIEEFTVQPARNHLPDASTVAEWITEWAGENGLLTEDGYDDVDTACQSPAGFAAIETCLNDIASQVRYRMAADLVATHHMAVPGGVDWPEWLTPEHSAIHTAFENEIKQALAHCYASADASGSDWTTEGWISCSATNLMGLLQRLGCPPPPVGEVAMIPLPREPGMDDDDWVTGPCPGAGKPSAAGTEPDNG